MHMDESKYLRLKVLERTQELLDEAAKEPVKPKLVHPNQSNPIYNNMVKFHYEKIGEKFSVRDLLR